MVQTLISNDHKKQDQNESRPASLSLWGQSGPILLLGAFTVLIFKYAPFFWPLFLVAFAGYAGNRFWKKGSLNFSIIVLIAIAVLLIRSGVDVFWTSLLSSSIALSWLLIFLGKRETQAFMEQREEAIKSLRENCQILEKQLKDAKASLSKGHKESILEIERLNHLNLQESSSLTQLKQSLELSEKEREKLKGRCDDLSQDIFAYQRKEIAFQRALDDAQSQLLKLKNQQILETTKTSAASNIVPQEDAPEEKMRYEQVCHQYALLREQFDEKSEALDKTRKELFRVENELLSLQKEQEETSFFLSEESLSLEKDLKILEGERCDLEAQIAILQELISSLLTPKTRRSRTAKSSNKVEGQEKLPFLIQEKIDQVSHF